MVIQSQPNETQAADKTLSKSGYASRAGLISALIDSDKPDGSMKELCDCVDDQHRLNEDDLKSIIIQVFVFSELFSL